MKKNVFLASLLLCGSQVFAQSVDFWYNGRALNEGETVVESKVGEDDIIKTHILGKNQSSEDVEATLTLTLLEQTGGSEYTGVGYCGWGINTTCVALRLNEPFGRTTIVAAGTEVDPEIKGMNFEPGSSAKVKYEMKYGSTTKTAYVKYYLPGSSITSAMTSNNVFVNAKDGLADINYRFDSDGYRTLNIYNSTGELVVSKVVSGIEGNLSFFLNKGVYLCLMEEKGTVVNTSKFLVK